MLDLISPLLCFSSLAFLFILYSVIILRLNIFFAILLDLVLHLWFIHVVPLLLFLCQLLVIQTSIMPLVVIPAIQLLDMWFC